MDQIDYWRVLLFVKGVESRHRMVRNKVRFERNELADDWIVKRRFPIRNAQEVWRKSDRHRCRFNSLLKVKEKSFSGDNRLSKSWTTVRNLSWNDLFQEIE